MVRPLWKRSWTGSGASHLITLGKVRGDLEALDDPSGAVEFRARSRTSRRQTEPILRLP